MNEAIALFDITGDACIPLVSTRIDGDLHDLMARIKVEQVFKNTEPRAIEAVYTFPMAHQAELMGLRVKLGERTLEGVVQAAVEAGEKYEQAISDGDGAILLEKIGDDDNLYSMSVGNIRPDETVVIEFEYALLNHLQGNLLRLSIPTTVSPRYGNPHRAGIQPHQLIDTDIRAEHRYRLSLRISGLFENASVECPTHKIREHWTETAQEITLDGDLAFLDRDFVLNIYPDQTISATAACDRDLEGYVVMASFIPRLPVVDSGPRDIRIVVDCSGSMAGDSIRQAAIALKVILKELRSTDVFNIVLFGSDYHLLFPAPLNANKSNIARAKKLVRGLAADLGGTEMAMAIRVTSDMKSSLGRPADILLITDGNIYQHEQIVEEVRAAGHRVLSVGVGSGVSEAFIRNIAAATGGMAEFATPNEDMAGHIVRHFQRIFSAEARAKLIWPEGIDSQAAEHLPVVYSGDTVHVFGYGPKCPDGIVELELAVHDITIRQTARIVSREARETIPSKLARLAARNRFGGVELIQQIELAVRYQLLTDQTSYLVIDKRDASEQTTVDPEIRKVRQMLTAGWGGSSSVKKMVSAKVSLSSLSSHRSLPKANASVFHSMDYDMECSMDYDMESEVDNDRQDSTAWDEFDSDSSRLKNSKAADLSSVGTEALSSLVKAIEKNMKAPDFVMDEELLRFHIILILETINALRGDIKLGFDQQSVKTGKMSFVGGNGRLRVAHTSRGFTISLAGASLEKEMYPFMERLFGRSNDGYKQTNSRKGTQSAPFWNTNELTKLVQAAIEYSKTIA